MYRTVYAVGHPHLSQEGRWMAAVLAAGQGAALSHLSAALLWRVWRGRAARIDVLVPRRKRTQPRVRLHSCRHLDPCDLTTHLGIPVTTVARTLVDLTDVLTSHQLANVIHEAAFRNRFNPRAARQAMKRANGRRNLNALDAALDAYEVGSAGTRSGLEDRFLALVSAAGLPAPLVNVPVPTGGQSIEVDLHWPEHRLCVEIDGPGHTRPRTTKEDAVRDRLLLDAQNKVLRVTEENTATSLAAVRAILRR